MRWIVVVFCTLAALALIGASMMLNWWFWSGQGPDPTTGFVLGVVSLGVDTFKAMLPLIIGQALAARRWLASGIGLLFFLACLGFSFFSALGSAATLRGATSADRQSHIDRLVVVRRDLNDINAQIGTLGSPRPAKVLEAEQVKAQRDRRWEASNGCREPSGTSRAFCQSVDDLGIELSRAIAYERQLAKRDALATEQHDLERAGAHRDADPQAAFLARLSGLSIDHVTTDLSLLLAILVELGGAFGLFLAMLPAQFGRHDNARTAGVTLKQLPHPPKALPTPTRFVRRPDGKLMIE